MARTSSGRTMTVKQALMYGVSRMAMMQAYWQNKKVGLTR